ncbi:KH domain-containing protein [bacterium]|nr:KH domain-containing protein [bacterium]
MEKLIRFVADSLAGRPEDIRIEKSEENGEMAYTLLVDPEDLGRMIGRHGKTAEALRTLLSAAGQRQEKRVFLRIRERD